MARSPEPIGSANAVAHEPNRAAPTIVAAALMSTEMINATQPVRMTLPTSTPCCLGAASTPRSGQARPLERVSEDRHLPDHGIHPTIVRTSIGLIHPLSRVSIFHEDAKPSCCAYIVTPSVSHALSVSAWSRSQPGSHGIKRPLSVSLAPALPPPQCRDSPYIEAARGEGPRIGVGAIPRSRGIKARPPPRPSGFESGHEAQKSEPLGLAALNR